MTRPSAAPIARVCVAATASLLVLAGFGGEASLSTAHASAEATHSAGKTSRLSKLGSSHSAGTCVGSKGRHEESGLNITFAIPCGFHIAHNITVARGAGAKPVTRAAFAIDEDNLIIIQRYNLTTSITSKNLRRFKKEIDQVIGSLARRKVSGRRITYGRMPGYEYVIAINSPRQGESRLEVLFDKDVEYLVNCQSTPEKRTKVEKGCRTLLRSIRHV